MTEAKGAKGQGGSRPQRHRAGMPRAQIHRAQIHRAVVLLNFGGPRDLGEVAAFLQEILSDPNTLQMPFPRFFQNLLARRIVRRRAPEIRRQYGEIGGKSPIVEATARVAEALEAALKVAPRATPSANREAAQEGTQEGTQEGAGRPLEVFVAHRYLPGWTERTAAAIAAAGVTHLLAVPFYPHFCFATGGSAFQQLREALHRAGYGGQLRAVRAYADHPGYLEALAARLSECLEREKPPPRTTVVLCSAHGLPAIYVKRGDPYLAELEATLAALRARFPAWRLRLSFQSRVGPMEWLRPYTDEIIPELGRDGITHVVFLPISFLNDHIETLYEIGHTYFGLARQNGLSPSLVAGIEAHPAFVETLAGFVKDWAEGSGGVALEALLPPRQDFARIGRWAWGMWLAALLAALWLALT